MGKFIFDPLTGEPTISAPERAKRHDETGVVRDVKNVGKKQEGKPKGASFCFFCKGSEHLTPPTLYQDAEDWNVRVFANKYPLLPDHEIIVHSPDHEKDFEELSCEQNTKIIRAFLNRVHYYMNQDKEMMIFNNRGGRAGASVLHPHSQIIAARGFPGVLEKEKEAGLHYYNENSSCYWCDEIKSEQEYQKRIVYETPHFFVYVPRACKWSYEMRLVPKCHRPNFGFIDEQEINDLASVLKGILTAYDRLFNRPDRNFWIHTMRYEPFHWHIGFMCHIKVLGALELGGGIWTSSNATPEDAALGLKNYVNKYCGEITTLLSE